MKLMVQPEDGAKPLIKAIQNAKKSVEFVIFRFDQRDVERAMAQAVGRGVAVSALIAYTNRTGEESLRKLELRLLEAGVTVARTADDLARYHGKLLIVDRKELHLLAFNPTYTDIEHCRSFGVSTKKPQYVGEAVHLFEMDSKRLPYEPQNGSLVVSPVNAREKLQEFIAAAKKELLIYDPKVSDLAIVRLLKQRAEAGVKIRIIGRLTRKLPGVEVCKIAGMRLHTRTMIRDGNTAFMGSQSLRAVELDSRREVGLIFREPKIVARIRDVFNKDWQAAAHEEDKPEEKVPAEKVAKKVAKMLTKDLPEVAPVLDGAVKEVVGGTIEVPLDPEEVEAAIRGAVKTAVKEVVSGMVETVVEQVVEQHSNR